MFFAILENNIFEIYEKCKKNKSAERHSYFFSGINKVGNIYADSL